MATNDWNQCNPNHPKSYPQQEGQYLCVVMAANDRGGKLKHVFLSRYDTKINSFEFDYLMQQRKQSARIYAWCRYHEPPNRPAEVTD